MRPSVVNREKASSHPLAPGRFYIGKVLSVTDSGQVSILLPDLDTKYGPLFPVDASTPSQYSVGDAVICTFSNEFFTELLVLGSMRPKVDASAALTERVAALETAVATTLIARIYALEEKVQALELGIWT